MVASPSVTSIDPCRATVILYRLSLDERKLAFLERAGVRSVRTSSVQRTSEILEEAAGKGTTLVVVDLADRKVSPEKILAHIEAASGRRAGSPPVMLGCATTRTRHIESRAAKLELKVVYLWPEGLFAEVLRRLEIVPQAHLKRSAPRAMIEQPFDPGDASGIDGRLVNISATGALVETKEAPEVGAKVELVLCIPPDPEPARIEGRVRWCARGDPVNRIGVQFQGLSRQVRRVLRDFVTQHNLIRVPRRGTPSRGSPPEKETLVKAYLAGSKRVDYFRLRGELRGTPILQPRRTFFVPYQPGDRLRLRFVGPGRMPDVDVEILERVALESERLDEKIGWRVMVARGAPAPDPPVKALAIVTRFG